MFPSFLVTFQHSNLIAVIVAVVSSKGLISNTTFIVAVSFIADARQTPGGVCRACLIRICGVACGIAAINTIESDVVSVAIAPTQLLFNPSPPTTLLDEVHSYYEMRHLTEIDETSISLSRTETKSDLDRETN